MLFPFKIGQEVREKGKSQIMTLRRFEEYRPILKTGVFYHQSVVKGPLTQSTLLWCDWKDENGFDQTDTFEQSDLEALD